MRGSLQKEVFAQFEKELSARLPQFELVSKDRPWRWVWKFESSLTFFVLMNSVDMWDKFFVEIAWSENGEFPWKSMGKTKIDRESGRDRLGRLWKKLGEEPLWDLAPEKTDGMNEHIDALVHGKVLDYPSDLPLEGILPRVCPLVHDALDKLEQYGVPLLRQVAEVRGLTWNPGATAPN
jgi:hypothetical protein